MPLYLGFKKYRERSSAFKPNLPTCSEGYLYV